MFYLPISLGGKKRKKHKNKTSILKQVHPDTAVRPVIPSNFCYLKSTLYKNSLGSCFKPLLIKVLC